jgi:hypothetical protein
MQITTIGLDLAKSVSKSFGPRPDIIVFHLDRVSQV